MDRSNRWDASEDPDRDRYQHQPGNFTKQNPEGTTSSDENSTNASPSTSKSNTSSTSPRYDFSSFRKHLHQASPQTSYDESVLDWAGYLKRGNILGMGSYGDVYEGIWINMPTATSTPPVVAVKFMRGEMFGTKIERERRLRRFRREAAVWQRLDHPNILQFVGILNSSQCGFALVSVRMKYGSVKSFLEEHPYDDGYHIIKELSNAVEYLHGLEIVHGDIKADNVLVGEDGVACLGDFNFSWIFDESSLWLTNASNAKGTLRYLSPELLCGDQVASTYSSDVYAYSMTALEILTRKPPFDHIRTDPPIFTAVAMRHERPRRPPSGKITDDIWDLLTSCWAQDPNSRPKMCSVVANLEQQIGRIATRCPTHCSTPMSSSTVLNSPVGEVSRLLSQPQIIDYACDEEGSDWDGIDDYYLASDVWDTDEASSSPRLSVMTSPTIQRLSLLELQGQVSAATQRDEATGSDTFLEHEMENSHTKALVSMCQQAVYDGNSVSGDTPDLTTDKLHPEFGPSDVPNRSDWNYLSQPTPTHASEIWVPQLRSGGDLLPRPMDLTFQDKTNGTTTYSIPQTYLDAMSRTSVSDFGLPSYLVSEWKQLVESAMQDSNAATSVEQEPSNRQPNSEAGLDSSSLDVSSSVARYTISQAYLEAISRTALPNSGLPSYLVSEWKKLVNSANGEPNDVTSVDLELSCRQQYSEPSPEGMGDEKALGAPEHKEIPLPIVEPDNVADLFNTVPPYLEQIASGTTFTLQKSNHPSDQEEAPEMMQPESLAVDLLQRQPVSQTVTDDRIQQFVNEQAAIVAGFASKKMEISDDSSRHSTSSVSQLSERPSTPDLLSNRTSSTFTTDSDFPLFFPPRPVIDSSLLYNNRQCTQAQSDSELVRSHHDLKADFQPMPRKIWKTGTSSKRVPSSSKRVRFVDMSEQEDERPGKIGHDGELKASARPSHAQTERPQRSRYLPFLSPSTARAHGTMSWPPKTWGSAGNSPATSSRPLSSPSVVDTSLPPARGGGISGRLPASVLTPSTYLRPPTVKGIWNASLRTESVTGMMASGNRAQELRFESRKPSPLQEITRDTGISSTSTNHSIATAKASYTLPNRGHPNPQSISAQSDDSDTAKKLNSYLSAYADSHSRSRIRSSFESYENRWAVTLPSLLSINWKDIPWPVVDPSKVGAKTDMTVLEIGNFLLSPWHSDGKSLKDRIARELRRWHTDRFEGSLSGRIVGNVGRKQVQKGHEQEERERIKDGFEQVVCALHALSRMNLESIYVPRMRHHPRVPR